MLFTLTMDRINSNATNNNGDQEGQDLKDMHSKSQKPKEYHSHLGILISLLPMYLHLSIPKTQPLSLCLSMFIGFSHLLLLQNLQTQNQYYYVQNYALKISSYIQLHVIFLIDQRVDWS